MPTAQVKQKIVLLVIAPMKDSARCAACHASRREAALPPPLRLKCSISPSQC